jgi:hypothetical protein
MGENGSEENTGWSILKVFMLPYAASSASEYPVSEHLYRPHPEDVRFLSVPQKGTETKLL